MSLLLHLCRYLLGAALCIFGLLRGIDSGGFSYKISEYIKLFNPDDFEILSAPIGILFATAAFTAGVGLLSGALLRNATRVALAVVFCSWAVAFLSWKYQVVYDCICFGDILSLNHAQGNLAIRSIALLLAIATWYLHKLKLQSDFDNDQIAPDNQSAAFIIWSGITCVALSVYGSLNLPLYDFRPYHTGFNILQNMFPPENAPEFEYETILYYKNKQSGNVQAFTDQNFPWQEKANWEYQHRETKLVKMGYVPVVTDFSIKTEDKIDITLSVLSDTAFNFLLISGDISRSNLAAQPKINRLYEFCKANGYHFRCLTASTPKQIAKFKIISGANYEFCTTDATVLKTMITSNPGLILLKNGVILKKWHHNNIPDIVTLQKTYTLAKQPAS